MATIKHIDEISDAHILHNFLDSGDMKHIGFLYKKYHVMVYGVCLKYFKEPETALDASMDIFENLHALIKKHEIQNFKPWLHRVASNHCLMKLRKTKLDVEYKDEFENDETPSEDEAFFEFSASHLKENQLLKMDECLEKLKDHQKKCIHLFYIEEKSYTEIIEITKLNFKEVKSFLQNGKLNLKKCMES